MCEISHTTRWGVSGGRMAACTQVAGEVSIRAVVLDIGSVLEVIDDGVFPAPFERATAPRRGRCAARRTGRATPVGEMTEAETRAHWQRRLALTDARPTS